MPVYDHIIVGAGSAGCSWRIRLAAWGRLTVPLLEAGPPRSLSVDPHSHRLRQDDVPPVVNWCFYTEPEPHMNARKVHWPRGRTLGGSSAINGLICIRGQREDYDHWAAVGNPGWAFADVLPYFRQLEHNVRGASELRGGAGRCGRRTSGARIRWSKH